jgi:electron transfer flavoprotein beta subunit
MKTLVLIQMVPDLVEELIVDRDGTRLDSYNTHWVINEFDDFALEQAVLLKERQGGEVIVVAPAMEGVEDVLFTAAAKGADLLIRLNGDFEGEVNNHSLARQFFPFITQLKPDLILTGVSAHHRHDGALGALIAALADLPYIGYVAGVTVTDGKAVARKEYPGGIICEMEVQLPAVLGIQSPDTPPRYVPISKIRQAMKTAQIEEQEAGGADLSGGVAISRLIQPQASGHAVMLEGDLDQIAEKLVAIFKEQGVL